MNLYGGRMHNRTNLELCAIAAWVFVAGLRILEEVWLPMQMENTYAFAVAGGCCPVISVSFSLIFTFVAEIAELKRIRIASLINAALGVAFCGCLKRRKRSV